ncbi:hypothetical protein [Nocardioides marmorisolisilvae]|uniref:Uncharacterized protein n=1 Tax=Nocardioides marmorisolisilvae TaxID=1542737 RepID=A0A3N0DWW7_9ACTN|nr:hypothetical protein [Nocardioides marmorisolisilvae]RNL80114.1 hypothetical protein EFL95_14485 [Nocardioides marmorisolisilvae]
MPSHASPALRWLRALAIASVAVSTGVIAHVSADGLLPGPRGITVLVVLCTALTAIFLGRRASTLRVVTLVVAGQAFIHSGLAAMAGHRGDPVSVPTPHPAIVPMGTGPRTGSYFDQWSQAQPNGAAGPAVPAWMVHTAVDIAAHPAMAVAHVLAAVAVGLWLSVGERALWAVLALTAALAVRLVRALAGLSVPPAIPVLRLRRSLMQPRISRTLQHSPGVSRRGPPLLLAAH